MKTKSKTIKHKKDNVTEFSRSHSLSLRRPQKTKKIRNHVIKSKTPSDIERVSLVIAKSLRGRGSESFTNVTDSSRSPSQTLRLAPNKRIKNPIFEHGYGYGYGKKSSYAPTINEQLVSLKSIPREKIYDCNNASAFKLEEPLKISISGKYYGNSCLKYTSAEAKKFLLHNLSANKHINPSKVVPPIQIQSNCWFNTMFVALFISDKGRKFFHYFRELMIESKQADGSKIPDKLADAFALLNFSVESALTGSKFAYELDTNSIIKQIYDSIPDKYHKMFPYLVGVDEASNPIRYYGSIISYLDERSLQFLFISKLETDWKSRVIADVNKLKHKPHVIIFEIFDNFSKTLVKPEKFKVSDAEYKLDSCIVRDMSQQHFSAAITCEGGEMAYDGMSFHRLVPMKWKNTINTNKSWGFEGSNDSDGTPLMWSFMQGYQLLLYYRVK